VDLGGESLAGALTVAQRGATGGIWRCAAGAI